MTNAQLTNANAKDFIIAGNARFTLVSKATGARFTYRVKASKDGNVFFVSVLTGSDNEGDYSFIGTIFASSEDFRHSRKSAISADAKSVRAFAWCWQSIRAGQTPKQAEVWHEGRCGRCNRALTVPESIATGLGPVCAAA